MTVANSNWWSIALSLNVFLIAVVAKKTTQFYFLCRYISLYSICMTGDRAVCVTDCQGYTSFLHLMVSWLRASYQQLVDDIIVNPYAGESGRDRSSSLDMIDHVRSPAAVHSYYRPMHLSPPPPLQPLNPNPDSQWLKYFKDNDILVQIDHDTRRLYPEISFFHLATQYPRTDYNAGGRLG